MTSVRNKPIYVLLKHLTAIQFIKLIEIACDRDWKELDLERTNHDCIVFEYPYLPLLGWSSECKLNGYVRGTFVDVEDYYNE